MTMSWGQPEVGEVIADRYRVLDMLGEGAMGTVYRGHDELLDRPVALKLLTAFDSRDAAAATDQFLREARLVASVQHRNVIQLLDFGTRAGNQPYMVMELLLGQTLDQRLRASPALDLIEAVRIVDLILRGLTAVHAAGIVHRDLKPDNIFLHAAEEGADPKILDFGISRSLGGPALHRPSAVPTQHGMVIGTPDYMAPEQARGIADIDARADIYAVGALLYRMLSGKLPFEAEQIADLLVKIVLEPPAPLLSVAPQLPRSLVAVIERAMAKEPQDRFQDARALRRALQEAVHGDFDSDRPSRLVSRAPSLVRAVPGWGGFDSLPGASGETSNPYGATHVAAGDSLAVGPTRSTPWPLSGTSAPPPGIHSPVPVAGPPSDSSGIVRTSARPSPTATQPPLKPPSLDLEIDYKRGTEYSRGRAAHVSARPMQGRSTRNPARSSRRPGAAAAPDRRWLVGVLAATAVLWIVAPYVILGSGVLREHDAEENTAISGAPSGSSRQLQVRRRDRPGELPPPMRDVRFD